jgi:hypothetical protein
MGGSMTCTCELELRAYLARAQALERSIRSRKNGKASLEHNMDDSVCVRLKRFLKSYSSTELENTTWTTVCVRLKRFLKSYSSTELENTTWTTVCVRLKRFLKSYSSTELEHNMEDSVCETQTFPEELQ